MKLLHLADLHLDSPFKGLNKDLRGIHPYLKDAPYAAFKQAVDLAIDEQVDAVVIVGDIYNSRQQSIAAQYFFLQQLNKLNKHHIPVVMSHGNHDYIQADQLAMTYPENVYVFDSEEPTSYTLTLADGQKVAFHGFSYTKRWIHERLIEEYPTADSQADIHIGLLHGSAEGVESEQANYAPFSVPQLLSKQYNYWALGHIHQPLVLNEEPRIQYAGTPQGRNRKEVGPLGGWLVNLRQDQPTQTRFVTLSSIQWEEATLDCSTLTDVNQLLERLEAIQDNYQTEAQASGRSYILTVQLTEAQALSSALQERIEAGELLPLLNSEEPVEPFVAVGRLHLVYDLEMEAFEYNPELNASFREALAYYKETSHYQEVMKPVFSHSVLQAWHKTLAEDKALQEEISQKAQASLLQLFNTADEGDFDAD